MSNVPTSPSTSRPRIPASRCPNDDCGHLHQFDDVDTTDAPRRFKPLGPGTVIVCLGCAQVNRLGTNLVLAKVEDLEFIKSDAVRAARWEAVKAGGFPPPADLVEHTAAFNGGDLLVIDEGDQPSGLEVMVVWPDETGPVDFGYVVSVTADPVGVELIATGAYPAASELAFRVIFAAWDTVADIDPGQPFTFEGLDGYEYVLAPVPQDTVAALELPGPGEVSYLQVLWQDPEGRWPWDEGGSGAPVIAGPDWRPDEAETVVAVFDGVIEGQVTTTD